MPVGAKALRNGVGALMAAGALFAVSASRATPYLVADADSGQVLFQKDATQPWYPASLTKLMTVYVALEAARSGKLTMDTPLVMSARAARMPPSKMGFRPGTQVTLDNALKMLMVKSPNDVAVMIAEGVSGSVESFAAAMNETAFRLGMRESHFVNPNGLHNPEHVSSARDMAILARSLLRDFPEERDLYSIGELQLGAQIIRNHNGLLGRYPGADGMKTGFTCPAGFNVVASANHYGRRLIVVVMGSPSAKLRTQEAADLFERGFATGGGSGSLEQLASVGGSAPNMRSDVCMHRSAAVAAAEEENAQIVQSGPAQGLGPLGFLGVGAAPARAELTERAQFQPVPVYVGPAPGWKGPALAARPAKGDALPATAKAYSADATGAADDREDANGEPSAPTVLKGAVKTPNPAVQKGKRRTAEAAKSKPGPKPRKPAKTDNE